MSTTVATHDDSTISMIVFLDLPPGTIVTIDGRIPLQLPPDRAAPALVGVRAIPSSTTTFHLVTVRCGSTNTGSSCSSGSRNTHGFVVVAGGSSSTATTKKAAVAGATSGCFVVHRFDPITEEVSGTPVDSVTKANVIQTIHQAEQNRSSAAQILLAALPTYAALQSRQEQQSKSKQKAPDWSQLTQYIVPELLQRRGLQLDSNSTTKNSSCIKLVPGVLPPDEDELGDTTSRSTKTPASHATDDAQSLVYPPIPVFPLQRRQQQDYRATSHDGTRSFLRNLPPSARTAFMLTAKHDDDDDDDDTANSKALQYLSQHYYGDRSSNSNRTTTHLLLGDLQLSFLLFWQLQCFASLTHWRDLTALLGNCCCDDDNNNNADTVAAANILYLQLMTAAAADNQHSGSGFLDEYQDSALVAALHRLGRQHGGLRSLLQRQGLLDVVDDTDDNNNNVPMEEDGPVIVHEAVPSSSNNRPLRVPPPLLAQRYPLLAAAMLEHEDILMTCARALDVQVDVGVVREAAAYLEEQEA